MAVRPDPSSFSRPDVVRVTKLHLDWLVDFDRKVISGTATLTIQRVQPDARQLVLDSRDLTLLKVEEGRKEGRLLEFSVGEKHPIYGSPITVSLLEPPEVEGEDVVRVTYETSPSSTALQWLAAGQTADGASPLLFSQCQAIHGRSLAPLQDAPAVKGPYSATVVVPRGLVALMSALRGAATDHAQGTSYQFSQPVPVPAYLLAVVVGRLDSATLGPRVTVWAEPSVLPRAATEFQETEVALEAAERLCGPYVWGHYGLVVLPPSFPYGGMENPCLTFVTPTLLAGDKSAVDVVIHEISHSWTGNLVTNRTWGDFWLNEGMTMLVQRKIEGALHGLPTRHFSAILGWKSLVDCISSQFPAGSPLTALVPDMKEVDPDDAFSTVPYEKGHTLLWYLEELLGGPAVFDPYLRAYLKKFAERSVSTEQWREHLYEHFSEQRDLLDAVDWETWLHAPGLPPYVPQFNKDLAQACGELAKKWESWEGEDEGPDFPFSPKDLDAFSSQQIVEFLAQLPPLPARKLSAMERHYGMFARTNCEIRSQWLRLALKARWEEAVGPALDFVTQQGRMKYTRPIYRELYAWGPPVRERAVAHFLEHEASMMHVSAHSLRGDLHLPSPSHS